MKKLNYLIVILFAATMAMTSVTATASGKGHDNHKNGHSHDNDKNYNKKGDKDKKSRHGKNSKKGKKSSKHKGHGNNHTKIGVCHNTESETNPVVFLTVSEKAAAKHAKKHGDIIGVDITSIDDCGPTPPPPPPPADEFLEFCAISDLSTSSVVFETEIIYEVATGLIASVPDASLPITGVVIVQSADGLYGVGNLINVSISGVSLNGSSFDFTDTEAESSVEFNLNSPGAFGNLVLTTDACQVVTDPGPLPF